MVSRRNEMVVFLVWLALSLRNGNGYFVMKDMRPHPFFLLVVLQCSSSIYITNEATGLSTAGRQAGKAGRQGRQATR